MGKDKHHATLLWGATGEQEWTAGLTTGKILSSMYMQIAILFYKFIYFKSFTDAVYSCNNSTWFPW